MPSPFWSGWGPGGGEAAEDDKNVYGAKSIQEGLLQIGSQACHILVHRLDSAAAEALHRTEACKASSSSSAVLSPGRLRRPGPGHGHDPEQYVVLLSSPRSSPRPEGQQQSARPRPGRPPRGRTRPSTSATSPLALPALPALHAYHAPASPIPAVSSKKLSSVPDEDIEQWGSRFFVRSEEDLSFPHHPHYSKWSSRGWCKPAYIPISIILIMIVLVVLLPLLEQSEHWQEKFRLDSDASLCKNTCRISLTESIPEGLLYPPNAPKFPSTYDVWDNLINISQNSIEIASLYWSLRGSDIYPHPSAHEGEEIFHKLLNAAVDRNIKLRIAQNSPSRDMPSTDTEELQKKGFAEVRNVNFAKLQGSGVLHTKFWIVDRKHVKELGAVVYDCPCLANDILKIFNVYWDLGKEGAVIPPKWPESYSTIFNMITPMNISLNGMMANTYLSSSPPTFCPTGRSGDVDTIVHLISKAEKFIYIAVMDYIPMMIYTARPKFWPVIDNALRSSAINNKVEVQLLVSSWNHTRKAEILFLKSLTDISTVYKNVNIKVKLFKVPASPDQQKIPFARVNHNKYMVTDNAAYIGTSNWSGDYFVDTAGVGLVITPSKSNRKTNPLPIRDQLQAVFERDWNSPYASNISEISNEYFLSLVD
ncbi:5'-3' exonuclease PLD3 [Frankliniella fusca]|uniref:5'-3' exonuclease PLD3 n=1 Tax=Frankliniella fusca TaxID=407009 RepID=A0AAE1GPD4_9NEOP|nr:5'-3' exonuclease PLD3 [Frankliniella fusca]